MREFRRFNIDDVNAGAAQEWTFASGWFPFQSSYWAWFARPVQE